MAKSNAIHLMKSDVRKRYYQNATTGQNGIEAANDEPVCYTTQVVE